MRKASAISFLALSIVLGSAAQLLFRYAMQSYDFSAGDFIASVALSDALILAVGVGLYAVSMITWILALVRFDVSLAYPALSIGYIIVYIAAVSIPALNESATSSGLVGIACIVIGVGFLSLGEKRTGP